MMFSTEKNLLRNQEDPNTVQGSAMSKLHLMIEMLATLCPNLGSRREATQSMQPIAAEQANAVLEAFMEVCWDLVTKTLFQETLLSTLVATTLSSRVVQHCQETH